ncbi:unconventional myosin-XVIIIa-like isoform X4, partial [Lates japonicus]
MFHLIKKDKEKEKDLSKKEKKDKKEKKERMSQAELKNLEEMSIRRGFFHLNRGSSKRDSRTKLEISSPIPIKVASNTELCLTNLEAERLHNAQQDVGQISASTSGEDVKGNELEPHRTSVKERAAKFGELAKLNTVVSQRPVTLTQRSKEDNALEASNLSFSIPKVTSVVHIPEMVEKTYPGADLQLPVLVAPPIPDSRELEIQRRNTGDFGFSLRRTTMLDRHPDGGVRRHVVHFAEPGAGTKDRALGLVPGDRLVEINGINVENKSRDEIVEMIRQSGESVRLKVQPILELSELNRSWLRTTQSLHKEAFDSKPVEDPVAILQAAHSAAAQETEEQITAEKALHNTEKYGLSTRMDFPGTELHLNHFAENNAFGIMPQTKTEDKQRASQQFSKLQAAMKVLGISGDEQRAFWLVLGAIYHLGAAGATKAGRKQFARHEWAQKAAYLLGCTLEELSSSIFKHQAKGTLPRASTIRQASDENGTADAGSKATAMECLEAMASGLYSELFTILISLINRALKSSQHSLCSLLIVDTPGFQNPRLAKRECGATFEDLCHNYTQERLQTLFYQRTFVQELERYKEENIELALDDTDPSPSLSVAVVDQASSQALVRTVRTDEARGLLWLMEEEALQPGGSEETLLGRLFSYYGPAEGESKGHTFLLKSEKDNHFLLGHSHGTDWVEYDVCGWLNYAKQNPASTNAVSLLQDSQKKIISSLVMSRAGGATVLSGSIAGLEGVSQLSLRRATSMRKTFTTGVAAIKKKSLCIQIKLQVDALLDMVRRSRIHFVHCILPKGDALKALSGSLYKGGENDAQGESGDPGLMQLDVALLRAQLRGSKLLDSLRIHRQGYPDHMVFSEFRRRFDVLAPHLTKKHGRNYIVKDERRAVEELLESLDLEKSSYHMGLSRLFFRAGTLAKLEEQRDEQTKRNLTLFQAACRGYLARQAFKKRKIQDLAIRCIQKNIKKNRGVKDWPWWKLFTTVQPLIKVQLTEEQMRSKDEEIQLQKSKLERVEKERNELRLNTDRLESR